MKVFFKLLYHQMAWTYDLVAWTVSVGHWKSWVRSALPFVEGKRVLELGHGPGHLQAALRKNSNQQVFGLDRSPQMGRIAARRLMNMGCQPGLVNGESQHLPFASETFDCIVATFPTDYLVQENTLKEVTRVLVPGGELVVLPAAWITGNRPHEKAAAGLFRLTGQSPPLDHKTLQPPPVFAGLHTRTEWVELPASIVMVVIAKKAAEAP